MAHKSTESKRFSKSPWVTQSSVRWGPQPIALCQRAVKLEKVVPGCFCPVHAISGQLVFGLLPVVRSPNCLSVGFVSLMALLYPMSVEFSFGFLMQNVLPFREKNKGFIGLRRISTDRLLRKVTNMKAERCCSNSRGEPPKSSHKRPYVKRDLQWILPVRWMRYEFKTQLDDLLSGSHQMLNTRFVLDQLGLTSRFP